MSGDRNLICPVDQTKMVMSARQGIEIDYCPSCRGVWLDRGELNKIIERTSAPGGANAPVPPQQAAQPAQPPQPAAPPQAPQPPQPAAGGAWTPQPSAQPPQAPAPAAGVWSPQPTSQPGHAPAPPPPGGQWTPQPTGQPHQPPPGQWTPQPTQHPMPGAHAGAHWQPQHRPHHGDDYKYGHGRHKRPKSFLEELFD